MALSDSISTAMLGAFGGAVATAIVGFGWGGWVTGGAADTMASEKVEAAIVEAFTPLCVASAEAAPGQLGQLVKTSNWDRGDYVIKAGWVAEGLEERHRSMIARACATQVVEDIEAKAAADKPKG
jgi:hypothetical protein